LSSQTLLCQPQFIPVFAGYYHGFYRFFPPSWQKYFLPWQKPNPGRPANTYLTHIAASNTEIYDVTN